MAAIKQCQCGAFLKKLQLSRLSVALLSTGLLIFLLVEESPSSKHQLNHAASDFAGLTSIDSRYLPPVQTDVLWSALR